MKFFPSHLLLALLAALPCTVAQQPMSYKVKIINLTFLQPFSPVLLVAHDPSMELFTPGVNASKELRTLAEEGNAAPLATSLQNNPNIFGMTVAPGPTPPLQTQELDLTLNAAAAGKPVVFSAMAMLVNTNDAFFGLQPVRLPMRQGVKHRHLVPAWDAGTEENNEGPACANSTNLSTNGQGEGPVHIHRGFFGLTANRTDGVHPMAAHRYDWRDRVAQVEITMVAGAPPAAPADPAAANAGMMGMGMGMGGMD
ncbi:hypothetical protein HK102_002044 [Quaeritorhiza haematococci]|nr:hypothetical protein HK102_002044 [Quaeritorhiza haematococci]